jgi:hypothetical protein
MARMGWSSEAQARTIAEDANPGWRAVAPEEEHPLSDSQAHAQAEITGLDMEALKDRYLGNSLSIATDAVANQQPDAYLVTLKRDQPAADSPTNTRTVVVSGGKVVGVQG